LEPSARPDLIAAAIRWSVGSVAWGLLVGCGSLAAGLSADSTALVGFGLSSLVDGIASCVLVWRFRHEQLGTRAIHEVERRAAYVIGTILMVVALYVTAKATFALFQHSGPGTSSLGIVLTGASFLVLPVLSRAKLRLARPLGSRALRADGVLSGAGAVLAAAVLTGLALDDLFDLWWADSVVAIGIAVALVREGGLSVRFARQVGAAP
jgi:divalent metal cation (Fe/Co/Zn/Cd) transporter